MHNDRGYTFTEIIIIITLIGLIGSIAGVSFIAYKNNADLDSVATSTVERVNHARTRAVSGVTDNTNLVISYGIIFLSDSVVEFTGDSYSSGNDMNILYSLPPGYSLSVECTPENTGVIIFQPIEGENTNNCTVEILRGGSAQQTLEFGRFGYESRF